MHRPFDSSIIQELGFDILNKHNLPRLQNLAKKLTTTEQQNQSIEMANGFSKLAVGRGKTKCPRARASAVAAVIVTPPALKNSVDLGVHAWEKHDDRKLSFMGPNNRKFSKPKNAKFQTMIKKDDEYGHYENAIPEKTGALVGEKGLKPVRCVKLAGHHVDIF